MNLLKPLKEGHHLLLSESPQSLKTSQKCVNVTLQGN